MPTVYPTRQNTQSREARIRLRAEELYRRRGNRPGSALDDWLLAEKEIREDEEHAIDHVRICIVLTAERASRQMAFRLRVDETVACRLAASLGVLRTTCLTRVISSRHVLR